VTAAADVWRGLAAGAWHFVECQFTDVAGALKSVVLPAGQVEETLRFGHWFDGSAMEGHARSMETDLLLRPDLASWGSLPWAGPNGQRTARVTCDVLTPDGQPFPGDPRGVLRRAVQEAVVAGLRYEVAAGVQWYLFRPDAAGRSVPLDRGGALDPAPGGRGGPGGGAGIGEEVVRTLEALGVPASATCHAPGPGQHEVLLPRLPALAAADAVLVCKFAVRAVAQRRGLRATFMPVPLAGAAGSALRLRQALTRAAGEDALSDPAGEWELSPPGQAFLAGQLHHLRALCAVTAPTVNSYKRLGGDAGGPRYRAWSRNGPLAAVRLPRRRRRPDPPPLELELRCADPACNPYLALAGALAAGLDGLSGGLTPPPPLSAAGAAGAHPAVAGAALEPLPATLGEALADLERDAPLRDALGPPVYERLVHAKSREWAAYQRQISPWELDRYFESA
jgi:glutamine synthetase